MVVLTNGAEVAVLVLLALVREVVEVLPVPVPVLDVSSSEAVLLLVLVLKPTALVCVDEGVSDEMRAGCEVVSIDANVVDGRASAASEDGEDGPCDLSMSISMMSIATQRCRL